MENNFKVINILIILHGFVNINLSQGTMFVQEMDGTDIKMVAEFLISVNDTWDPNGCIATVKTPPLTSGTEYNQSDSIAVGSCDNGPFRFKIKKGDDSSKYKIDVIFFSSVIEDASSPTCSIMWNGTYLTPTTDNGPPSLLPGCYTMDSREGYHMTYYWFYLLKWQFLDK
ncbi:hypothetical protein SNE40_003693 [Patella caerulea]|uniref:Uncharacterized protein n=2 Tax=Patella caerulea TaxID=87958 RepID=A0AAN8KAC6_PATCE